MNIFYCNILNKVPKTSAGLLMYRKKKILEPPRMTAEQIEVFLVHPGGPFFKNRDDVWSIPKGLQEKGEDLLETAKREFCEETNLVIPAREPESIPIDPSIRWDDNCFLDLDFVEYNSKKVYCWAFESDSPRGKAGLPKSFIFKSNPSKFKWPENDRGEFFDLETAKIKILPAQLPFLAKLASALLPSNPHLLT